MLNVCINSERNRKCHGNAQRRLVRHRSYRLFLNINGRNAVDGKRDPIDTELPTDVGFDACVVMLVAPIRAALWICLSMGVRAEGFSTRCRRFKVIGP